MEDPYGLVKKFDISYTSKFKEVNFQNRKMILLTCLDDVEGETLIKKHTLEGQIIAITEEGYGEPNWYEIRVNYPDGSEIAVIENYEQLRNGRPQFEEAEKALRDWCKKMDFDISEHYITQMHIK